MVNDSLFTKTTMTQCCFIIDEMWLVFVPEANASLHKQTRDSSSSSVDADSGDITLPPHLFLVNPSERQNSGFSHRVPSELQMQMRGPAGRCSRDMIKKSKPLSGKLLSQSAIFVTAWGKNYQGT